MSYQLTGILNRCNREDADFLIDTIDSFLNFTDTKGLKEISSSWDGRGAMPLALNHKIEREIRYLGSNDVAYMTRKLRGCDPAGVSVDEIIDDLCKLLKFKIDTSFTLEARLEIFAGKVVDQQFAKLPRDRQIELLNNMAFDQYHRKEIFEKVINNKELLLPVLLPLLGKAIGPEVFQGFIIAMLSAFLPKALLQEMLIPAFSRLPVAGPMLGPLILGASTLWTIYDLLGPASRKTIPLILYLGVLCLRDGETPEFLQNLKTEKMLES